MREYKGKFFFPALFFLWIILLAPIQAQVTESDSLEIAGIFNQAREQVIKHNYSDAIRLAQLGLEKSIKPDFKWGIINSHLIIGQSQKALANYAISLNHYLQALSEIEKQDNKQLLEWINIELGELFQEWGVHEKALAHYNAALDLQLLKNNQQAVLIERVAEVHLKLNQSDEALAMYLRVLKIIRATGDATRTKKILENIAFIYSRSDDIENSLKYYLEVLEIDKQINNEVNTATTLNIVGNHYKDLKKLDRALEYYQAALRINRKYKNDNNRITNLINIGTVYQLRGDNRNAIKSFHEALTITEKSGTPTEIAVMYNYLASLYLAQGNLSEAERCTKKSIALLSGTDNKRLLARNYKRLSEIYAKQGSYDRALISYQTYSILNDSLLYREQIMLESENVKLYEIEAIEKEAKLSLIDHEMQALQLRNEKEITEREKQQILLLLKEKELQNLSLQTKQLEQARAVQQLQLQQSKIEQAKQDQEILLLEQKRDLQQAEIERNEFLERERQEEIALKNTTLALQQAQLDQISIRQQYLMYTAILFFALILLILIGYMIKRQDNKKLQAQYMEINKQKEQIESINKTLVELNDEKNDLIGIVAHDLKSPLNQISGMLEIIRLTAPDQSPEQQQYITSIGQSTNRLKSMISKILDVSAIESKALNISLEQVNVVALLDEIVNRFTDMAAKKSIVVDKNFQPNVPTITSDAGYLSEVLENLMSNAVKYSPLGKQIVVKLCKNHAFVRIEFIDQGQGISKKDMKNLFGKYHKLTARPTAGEDSTGLGLSIVKKYVEALNGKVWCESEEGKGSNFIVELPV
jgi:signal transduction histidine kinase